MRSADADAGAGGGRGAGGLAVKLRSLVGKLWHKDGAKQGQKVQHEVSKMALPKIATVESMAEQIKQLTIAKREVNFDESDEEDIVVTKFVKPCRNTSKDSGFSDKNDDYLDDDEDDDAFKTVQISISKKIEDSKIERDVIKDGGGVSKIEQDQIKDGGQDSCKTPNVDGKKPKQLKKVFLSRQPIRNNIQLSWIGPYPSLPQQFQQINHQTFSGCQVTINSAEARDIDTIKQSLLGVNPATTQSLLGVNPATTQSLLDVNPATTQSLLGVNPATTQSLLDVNLAAHTQLADHEQEETLDDLMKIIGTDLQPIADDETTPVFDESLLNPNMAAIPSFGNSNPSVHKNLESNGNIRYSEEGEFFVIPVTEPTFESPDSGDIMNWNLEYESNVEPVYQHRDLVLNSNDLNMLPKPALYLTPPPSNESTASSCSYNRSKNDSESMYSPNRDYSSDISQTSPIHAEYEKFQAIPKDDIPKCVEFKMAGKAPEKKKDGGSMTLKQYKEVMKTMEAGFAEMDCCKAQNSGDVIKDCYKKLSPDDRRQMSLVLAKCSLESAYGVLYHLLESVSARPERGLVDVATFVSICCRIRDERPQLYLSEFGLDLLAVCCLACPAHPHLTDHVVSCVRTALEGTNIADKRSYVFDTVDISGDNLLGACARRGDLCASVLCALTNKKPGEVALFDVNHTNYEGLSALHLACACDDGTPRTRTVHVLLAHAHADPWQKDIKSGDLALHHAIRDSPTVCDLTLCLFLHLDCTKWYSLAKAKNYSSLTPLQKAKSAAANTPADSTVRRAHCFLAKCRPKQAGLAD